MFLGPTARTFYPDWEQAAASSPGQQLVVYHADVGSPSAEALRLLGTLDATRAAEQQAN